MKEKKQELELLFIAAHEIRGPMASMKVIAETLLSKDHWDENVYRDFLVDLNSEIGRLGKIVDDVLDMAEIGESMGIRPVKSSMSEIKILLEFAVKQLEPMAEKKNIKINTIYEKSLESLEKLLMVDQDRFKQMILNILGNAVKYSADGFVVLSLYLNSAEDGIILSIKDSGPGIKKENLDRIFERFYRIKTAPPKEKGTGLGLYIAKSIADQHGFKIVAESELGRGTEFKISASFCG